MRKIVWLLIFILQVESFHFACAQAGVNGVEKMSGAFSKIVIKSNSATFCKDKNDASQFLLQYKNNVSVTFADGTVITSDKLDAFLDKSLVKEKKSDPQDGIKKILFTMFRQQ